MTHAVYGSEAIELLEAAGFVRLGERGLISMIGIQAPNGRNEEVYFTVRDPATGATPDASSTSYVVVAQGRGESKDLVLRTEDARDVAAFSIACRNNLLSDAGWSDDVPEEHSFLYRHTRIINPFADMVHGDWTNSNSKHPWEIHLVSPEETYGDAYVLWRDELAASLLAAPEVSGPKP